jgi:hypothetical protein
LKPNKRRIPAAATKRQRISRLENANMEAGKQLALFVRIRLGYVSIIRKKE